MSGVSGMPSLSMEQRLAARQKSLEKKDMSCLVEMDGIRNMRDMGGYTTVDGSVVARGKIYRSASLYNATVTDLDYLLGPLAIRHIIDFRNASETAIEPEPERLLKEAQYYWMPIMVEGTAREDIVRHLQQDHPEREDFSLLLQNVNRYLVLEHQAEMRSWFDLLLRLEPPVLFHCTEGKDRTGVAAALLLSVLGVEREEIFKDYLLTNIVNADSIEERIEKSRVLSSFQINATQLRRLLMAHRDYLQAAFTAIDEKYGSIDNYLVQALDIDAAERAVLKAKFLE